MQGWISLHRKIRQNPVFSDLQLFRLWIICLTEASHKEHEILVGKQVVKLEKGQFVTGRFEIGLKYNEGLKPKDRVKDITVWRWLKTLEELDFMIINSNNKFSLCTVLKWSDYQNFDQQNDQQMINKRSANDQQMITNNNVNKGNNENKDTTTRENHLKILNLYCSLHNKMDINISAKDRGSMMDIAGSEIPLDFILENMRKVFERSGEQIKGFGYYSTTLKDAWTKSITPIVSHTSKNNTNKVNDIFGRFLNNE